MTAGLTASVGVVLGDLHLDVDLSVGPGETVAVVGPNGAGKTTLVRALAGLVPLTRGQVTLAGAAPGPGAVGLVPQDLALFPHLSALENVAFGLRARGRRRGEARALAAAWLDRLGLAAAARLRPGQLSGGQAQRVALARALAPDPDLLLLDEPLSALDATTRVTTRRQLQRHLDAFAGPRLLVTHDPLDAMSLAVRLIVIEGGRVVQEGAAADIAARPRSRYVADLVGVNLLTGTARDEVVALDGGGAVVAAGAADGPVLVVVHPRAVALHRSAPDGTPRNVWEGVVSDVDPEGPTARVTVDGRPPLVAEVTTTAVGELGIVPGAAVWVAVKATEVAAYPA